jgi:hypothetical protein
MPVYPTVPVAQYLLKVGYLENSKAVAWSSRCVLWYYKRRKLKIQYKHNETQPVKVIWETDEELSLSDPFFVLYFIEDTLLVKIFID